jgi:hypothetical protein
MGAAAGIINLIGKGFLRRMKRYYPGIQADSLRYPQINI